MADSIMTSLSNLRAVSTAAESSTLKNSKGRKKYRRKQNKNMILILNVLSKAKSKLFFSFLISFCQKFGSDLILTGFGAAPQKKPGSGAEPQKKPGSISDNLMYK